MIIWPTPLIEQAYLAPVTQDHVQLGFEYLQGWRVHSLSRQPVPVLSHPDGKKMLRDVHRRPPVFHFVSIASSPATGNH